MAKKKAKTTEKLEKNRNKPGKRSGWGWLFHLLASPLVRYFLLTVFFVAIIAWKWLSIVSFALRIAELLGWGLLLIALAIGIVSFWIWRKRLKSFIYHGNRWLGGVAFLLAVWGVLAFFGLGGRFGLSLIDSPDFMGTLRVIGLVFLGLVITFPKASFRVTARFIYWIRKRFQKRPIPRYLEEQLVAATTASTKPLVKPEPEMKEPLLPSEGEMPEPAVTRARGKRWESPEELRQVAAEVWRKYGQSVELMVVDGWKLPPIDILDVTPEIEFSQVDNLKRAKLIEEALASYGVEARVVQINTGPTVTQFGVEPGWDRRLKEVKERDKDGNIQVRLEEVAKTRVKVERITSLANDLALALAAPSIRIEAPVPGKSIVGIEVPNTRIGIVSLRGVIETSAFQKIGAKSKLAIALGKGAGGEAVAADLSKMPHLLIAGATGSGKTVCLNAIICGLLMYNTPYDVRFIMVDPKRVELTPYNSLPHLATPVIVETEKALNALRWLNQEMDQRYRKMQATGTRNIDAYNKTRQGGEKLPYLTLVIDELADLMMARFDEVEHILCRLAQLARATGIHLVVATQRPSVDVVTGLIKANFPTRISFAVTSQVDSRTILDSAGAEKLLGRGDMLYMPTEAAKPKRLQGCFVSDTEIERLVYFWNSQQREEVAPLRVEEVVVPFSPTAKGVYPPDPLLEAARKLAQEHEHISTSFLQRKLRIGYPRAARLMEQLEEEGFKRGEEGEKEV